MATAMQGLLHAIIRRQIMKPPVLARNLTVCKHRTFSSHANKPDVGEITICGATYKTDEWTNITPKILSRIGRNLHNTKHHPLNLVRHRIQKYFYANYVNRLQNPVFAVYDNLSPCVTVEQNFDSLLTPAGHPSRARADTYYVNRGRLLRAHTSAHQVELIRAGCDAFLVAGDVYRRDTVDFTHYPVFHQVEGVRLFDRHKLFRHVGAGASDLQLLEPGRRTEAKQACHTLEAAKMTEHDLKAALTGLAHALFGQDLETRWVSAYFPFTHPSWELEIRYRDEWLEVLGCGIVEQPLLLNAGAGHKIGWAFGLGLERLAMKFYGIPDIRLFWSQDEGFLSQFAVDDPEMPITYSKALHQFLPRTNDISFWVPEAFSPSDFYDVVRSVGGDVVERVSLFDDFFHPGRRQRSHAFRIVYRHLERTLSQEEVTRIHEEIGRVAVENLSVELR